MVVIYTPASSSSSSTYLHSVRCIRVIHFESLLCPSQGRQEFQLLRGRFLAAKLFHMNDLQAKGRPE
jgi:hypothetical protein